jgi:hypothetical protein
MRLFMKSGEKCILLEKCYHPVYIIGRWKSRYAKDNSANPFVRCETPTYITVSENKELRKVRGPNMDNMSNLW